MDNAEQLAT